MDNEEKKVNDVQPEKKEVKVTLSEQLFLLLFPFVAIAILVIYKMVTNFGVFNATVRGIAGIFILGISFAGMIVALFRNKKPTYEFWLSAGVLGLTLMVF